MLYRVLLVVLIGAAFVACQDPPLAVRGDLGDPNYDPAPDIPAEFQVGVPSTVTVLTYGASCVSAGHAEVDVTGMLAIVEPFDWLHSGGCLDIRQTFVHTADVVFTRSGTAKVLVVGYGQTVEREVEVR